MPSSFTTALRRCAFVVLFVSFAESGLTEELGDLSLLPAPFRSDRDAQTFLFSIPAPRGLIVDRNGEPLAQSKVIRKAALRLDALGEQEKEAAIEAALQTIERFPYPEVLPTPPTAEVLRKHWTHRQSLPFVFTKELSPDQVEHLSEACRFEPALSLQTEYEREYPQGRTACHLVGYIKRGILRPSGPVLPSECLWPQVEGAVGLEKTQDSTLRGSNGLINWLFDEYGLEKREQLVRGPEPGQTVVLTINLEMQALAETILEDSGRFGAFVVMEASSGDILALASHPTFDVSKFVPRISPEELAKIQETPGNPFFSRAFAGAYPPGSIFKPLIALSAMKDGPVHGTAFRYYCGTSLNIAGRTFRNWSSYERGSFNVCEAIRRSNNVWFYKAALDTGGKPILKTARNFGIGSGPKIGLEGVASGTIAEAIYAERALANFSIGQGNLLTSPLQMTLAYCALANGKYLPVPRLIGQIQAPPPSEAVLQRFPPRQAFAFDFSRSQMQAIQQGLREVVNHRSGTGTRAKLHRPTISGKTGTAQWAPKDGKERWVVWFSGYVLGNPKLVFTVMCESQPGEQIFGGEVAAPLAASFLQTVYDDPNRFRLRSIPSKDPRPLASVESSPMGQIALHRN